MVILNTIKSMVDTALSKKYAEGILTLEFAMSEENYKRNLYCSKQRIINPEYSFKYKGVMTKRPFEEWVDIPHAFKNGTINTFFVAMDLNEVRRSHEVFYDANELVSLRPSAPEQFLVISLSINSDKCTLCPQEYNKNEILSYFQVRKIWNILSSCADGANGRELVYLYKNKIDVSFLYTYEDLSFEFDGLAKLESIFADPLHKEEKKQILQNVLFSFLWRERKDSRFPKLLRDFTVFATMFHESYLAFTVGFNFDKVRKEYQEKFRDYLSKLNAVLHDVLTRSLAIPVSGIISFAAMGKSMDLNSGVINLAAIALQFIQLSPFIFWQTTKR